MKLSFRVGLGERTVGSLAPQSCGGSSMKPNWPGRPTQTIIDEEVPLFLFDSSYQQAFRAHVELSVTC